MFECVHLGVFFVIYNIASCIAVRMYFLLKKRVVTDEWHILV